MIDTMTREREQIYSAIRAFTSATVAEAEAATKAVIRLIDNELPDDGSCVRCGSVPRNASGLCNTCLDDDAERAGGIPPNDWLPIDTAPEDQHVILATLGGHVGEAIMLRDDDTRSQRWAWAHGPVHENHTPTGWQPMPQPMEKSI